MELQPGGHGRGLYLENIIKVCLVLLLLEPAQKMKLSIISTLKVDRDLCM
jgi:hypothetical protein